MRTVCGELNCDKDVKFGSAYCYDHDPSISPKRKQLMAEMRPIARRLKEVGEKLDDYTIIMSTEERSALRAEGNELQRNYNRLSAAIKREMRKEVV